MKKFEKEKKIIEEKELKEKLRIITKHQKVIFKNKYKYNSPVQKKIKKTFSDLKKQKNK